MYNLASLLQDKSLKVGKTTFIAVDGHGGSGKSSLAQLLSEKFHAEIIHTDDFASWDNPTEWHSILIEKVFLPVQRGAITLSYNRSKWWDNHHPEPVQNQPVTNIMILEGVRSLRTELREYISFGIFVDTPREVCLERGIARDIQTGKTKDEVLKLWTDWLDAEDVYFAKDEPQSYANIVVDGTKSFDEQIQFSLNKEIPQIIKDVGFDFSWSEEKVWVLDVSVEEMNINELTWHFNIPFLWENGGVYNLTSREVIEHPDEHKAEYDRTMSADLSYPIDIMENKGRWLILDGLHRLMKASILKRDTVQVRKISRDRIPEIVK